MIVITGATGNIGRLLVKMLAGREEEVVAVSRTAVNAANQRNVRWEQGDVSTARSLGPIVRGARAVFLVLPGSLTSAGEDPEELIDTVARAEPERIVFVSSQIVGTRPGAASHRRLSLYEQALRTSGLDVTVLRPNGFASNTLGWADSIQSHRTVYAPFADVALPAVDPDDIAAVGAAALTEAGHAGSTYVLTGGTPITPRQQAHAIAEAANRAIDFVEVSRAVAFTAMTQFMDEEMAAGSLDVLESPTEAERAISSDVQRVLGRPAHSYSDWLARNVGAFQ